MTQQKVVEQFKYPECGKGSDHVGQILNLVCLEPKCIQNSIICGICYDQKHKNHKIKPLKMVINQSKTYLEQLTPMNIDSEKIKKSIEQSKVKLIQKFDIFEKEIHTTLTSIKHNINAVFIKIVDQIQLKTGSNDALLKALEEIKVKQIQYQRFIALMQKLLAGVPIDTKDDSSQLSSKDIQGAVVSIQNKIQKDMQKKSKKVQQELQNYLKGLQKIADNPSIFDMKIDFKFSSQLKHNGVTVVSDKVIKSSQAYNYHFGLLEPSIQEKGNRPFSVAFKINTNTSNWLAVGVCYKGIVSNNGYQFNYSTLGHGAYLISCNAGSWSSINASKNNVVNAFNYYAGDTIIITYDPDESKVVFKKKGTEETHTLEFEPVEGDELHLCGLFYYNNDQIQYLGYEDQL